MRNYKDHLIPKDSSVKQALTKLNELSLDAVLFVINNEYELLGSITDGDIRRGLLTNINLETNILEFVQPFPKKIVLDQYDISEIIELKSKKFQIIPIVNNKNQIIDVINLRISKSFVLIDAIIMAGGEGKRLRPLTENIPKPLIEIDGKPILEYNIDRLSLFGIRNFWISVNYLGDQIVDYFGSGEGTVREIKYVWEDTPLGTIGAASKIFDLKCPHVLVSNSDILTNLDYESFYLDFVKRDADFSVVTVPYDVKIPFGVLETEDRLVTDLKEKPTYTYYSNGGIYLMRREVMKYIPLDRKFDATDLMKILIRENKKVVSYPFSGYWLDIGRMDDLQRAKRDIKQILL